MVQGKPLYAQSGGVAAVIDATASAVLAEARAQGVKVLAARNGILGVLREDLIDASREKPWPPCTRWHTCRAARSARAGSRLKSVEADRVKYERLLDVLAAHDVRWFLCNGGNDSADTH